MDQLDQAATGEVRELKRDAIDRTAIKRAVVRATRESASLEQRTVPSTFVRSAKTGQFLAQRKHG